MKEHLEFRFEFTFLALAVVLLTTSCTNGQPSTEPASETTAATADVAEPSQPPESEEVAMAPPTQNVPEAVDPVAIATAAFAQVLDTEFASVRRPNETTEYLKDIANYSVVVTEDSGAVRVQFMPRDERVAGGGGEFTVDKATGELSEYQGYE